MNIEYHMHTRRNSFPKLLKIQSRGQKVTKRRGKNTSYCFVKKVNLIVIDLFNKREKKFNTLSKV